jgi:hypothetical protein
VLGCGEHSAAERPGQFNLGEIVGRKEIVLAGFVDDAELSVPGGVAVRQHLVDLASFERNLVAVVSDAHDEPLSWRRHGRSIQIALDLELSATDAGRLVPV